MKLAQLITQMTNQAAAIGQLAGWVSDEQAHWRPAAGQWSILEVVNHLYDEEREDFRVRLDIILHRAGEPWPRIDPRGWVTARCYNERDLAESLANFRREREASLAWLAGLEAPDWTAVDQAPWGPITAGDMMAAWAAHDLLHIRQLVELHYAYARQARLPYRPDYAGDW